MYKFRLPIGDWSSDGHGKCDYYTILSNKSIDEVREIHFKIKESTGIDLHEICNKYEENNLSLEFMEKLRELGFDDSKIEYYEDNACIFSENMRDIWVFLLSKTDSTLELKIEDIPEMLSFYGFDNKGRHIGFIGYGCFY